MITFEQFMEAVLEEDGKWIKDAIKHPGRCTPITKPGCTGHAKALAKRFKSGDLHKDNEKKDDKKKKKDD